MNINPWFVLFFTLCCCSVVLLIGFKLRRLFLLRLLGSAAVCGVGLYFFPDISFYGINLGFVLAFVLAIFVVSLSYNQPIRQSVFVISAAYAMQNCGFNVHFILSAVITLGFFSNNSYVFTLVFSLALSLLYYFVFMRRMKTEDGIVAYNGKMLVLSGMSLLSVYILSALFSYYHPTTEADIIGRILLIICCIFALFAQSGFFMENKLQRENEMFEQLLYMEKEQHKISKENIELINLKCHDLKHQIAALRNIDNKNEQDKYLRKIEQSVMIYDSMAKTGNEALDIVLTEKSLLCEKNQIKFTYMVDKDSLDFMDTMDIYTLFGNSIDNAIESVMKTDDPEKRIISFVVSSKGKIVRLRMENYCENKPVFRNGLPVTTKNGNGMHGFGMRSIRSVAEKYGGTMSASYADNLFVLNVLYPR